MIRVLHTFLSFFSRTANLFAFILLLLAIAAAYVNPDYFWPLALFGLLYPAILALNIFFLLSWIFRRRWFFLLSFSGILLSYPQLKAQIAFGGIGQDLSETPDLRIMSYNVRSFDLYNWSKNQESRQSMMDTISKYDPDIICFQEFYSSSKNFNNTEFLNNMGYTYHVEAIELIKDQHQKWGVSIFSKYPLESDGEFIRQRTPSAYGYFYNRGAYADVVIKDKKIRIISAHLQSVYLEYEDYDTIKEIKDEKSSEKTRFYQIGKKLAKAFMQRGIQVIELTDFVKNSPYPVILCGDFNDTPASFAYQKTSSVLKDAFLQGGTGIGATYNGLIPFLRIDYIFLDKDFRCSWMEVNGNPNSDHFPIVADIHFNASGK